MNANEEKQKQNKILSQIKTALRNSHMFCFWKISTGEPLWDFWENFF